MEAPAVEPSTAIQYNLIQNPNKQSEDCMLSNTSTSFRTDLVEWKRNLERWGITNDAIGVIVGANPVDRTYFQSMISKKIGDWKISTKWHYQKEID